MGNYKENILNGADPVFSKELIPVNIADNGIVTKANTDVEWYSYENSRWANAVLLTGSDTYSVGQTIPEEAIESYFVWIPKYKYQIWCATGTCSTPQVINIEFGTDNVTGSDNGSWLTHPAFTSLGVNGLWVGKFEATGTIDKVTVKPNVKSLQNQTIGAFYDVVYNYKRELDSHMMKNTEWGAMAYLTNSKYGRGNSEIWNNNNSNYVTGCVGETTSANSFDGCQNPYGQYATTTEQREKNVHGSTTDNISGIFDASGGAWEYVLGYLKGYTGLSGLIMADIDVRYYDRYPGSTVGSDRFLGDATAETKGWNGDYSYFVTSSAPWFLRGCNYSDGNGSGVFSFSIHNGSAGNYGYRLVLSPAV